jgi:hypothetical protein
VRVAGRDRQLVLQAGSLAGPGLEAEIARLRRSLADVGRRLPARAEPLLKAREK